MNEPASLEGRVAVVTGAGTGIGRAIAERIARHGASVPLMGRRTAPLEETAAAIGEAATVFPVDVADRDAVNRTFEDVHAKLGSIHDVVVNAGIGGPNEPGPNDRWDAIVATNLTGAYSTIRAFEEHAADGPEPRHAVVISSCLARFGVPGYTAYCASKAGTLGMVRAFAHELASRNILVNAICPGWVDTQMAREGMEGIASSMGKTLDEARPEILSAVPLERMSEPDEIAGLVAFLLSPDARTITGATFDQNAGSWM